MGLSRATVFVMATAMTLGGVGAAARDHQNRPQPLYRDPKAPLEQRVEDLLGRILTLEEKDRPRSPVSGIVNRKY